MISLNRLSRVLAAQKGFSLMELMLTLTIGSILIGVAVPAFRGMMNSSRVLTQSNEVVAALNLARSEAITRNRQITFCAADTATSTACNTTVTNWNAWVVLAGTTLIRGGDVNNYGSTLKVYSALSSPNTNTVVYSSDGLARTSTGVLINTDTITICTTYTKIDKNIFTVSPGFGSRISTATSNGTC